MTPEDFEYYFPSEGKSCLPESEGDSHDCPGVKCLFSHYVCTRSSRPDEPTWAIKLILMWSGVFRNLLVFQQMGVRLHTHTHTHRHTHPLTPRRQYVCVM